METESNDFKEMKFETALEELEQIVVAMESGELPLEDMMKQFERGMKLAQFCTDKLGETEKRIEILMKKAGGETEWRDMSTDEPVVAQ